MRVRKVRYPMPEVTAFVTKLLAVFFGDDDLMAAGGSRGKSSSFMLLKITKSGAQWVYVNL
jgi:hypothetical protein